MSFRGNKTAFKIFILVFIAGVIGVAGVAIMQHEINEITKGYEQMSENYVDNCLKIDTVNNQILESRCVLLEMITSDDSESEHIVKAHEMTQLKESVNENMAILSVRMKTGVNEQLYHKLYSDVQSYFSTSDIAHQIFDDGNTNSALYYINNGLKTTVSSIEKSMQDMKERTEQEMQDARQRMEKLLKRSKVIRNVCLVIIIISVLFCIQSCVTLAAQLEKYKDKLEKKLEEKTRELIEHNKRIIKIQDGTISGLANLIESRDNETGGHILRTSRYVEMLAKKCQKEGYCLDTLTDEYIDLLVRAAPMHDIGKISVSDLILKKNGKLTPEEFDIMKAHAAEGGRIIRDVMSNIENTDYVNMAAQVAEGHHEQWNGGGYPRGLSGEDIPICARIMAIADVFDALISKRCYKEAFSLDKSFRIISESAGTHFDPTLTKMFLEMKDEISKAAEELSDENIFNSV